MSGSSLCLLAQCVDLRCLQTGLGKTMQTIALICTDDTGEGVLKGGPEEPDERYDDMTLIGKPAGGARKNPQL